MEWLFYESINSLSDAASSQRESRLFTQRGFGFIRCLQDAKAHETRITVSAVSLFVQDLLFLSFCICFALLCSPRCFLLQLPSCRFVSVSKNIWLRVPFSLQVDISPSPSHKWSPPPKKIHGSSPASSCSLLCIFPICSSFLPFFQ